MSEVLATNTLTFIHTIEDWFGSSYNPEDGKFYEKDDRGVQDDVCERSMDAVRGARFVSVLLPKQADMDALERHHEAHEIALEVAGIGIKELHIRVAGHQAMIGLFFGMSAWVIWGEGPYLKWICVITAFLCLGAAIFNLMKSRAHWAHLLLAGAIDHQREEKTNAYLKAQDEVQDTDVTEETGTKVSASSQKEDL